MPHSLAKLNTWSAEELILWALLRWEPHPKRSGAGGECSPLELGSDSLSDDECGSKAAYWHPKRAPITARKGGIYSKQPIIHFFLRQAIDN